MTTKIFDNQKKAANEIYERLVVHNDAAVNLNAQPQVGKTGTVIDVCQQLADKNPEYTVLYFGPSDKQLHIQSRRRFIEYPKAFFMLLGSDVYHDGEIYPGKKGTKYKEIVQLIKMKFQIGAKFLVIRDEAHIGIGGNPRNETLQKIPQFLEDIFGSLPGTSKVHEKVQYLLVTATPFTYDFQIAGEKATITEIYLDPGAGYMGASDLIDAGRILPNVARSKPPVGLDKEEKALWREKEDEYLASRIAELAKEQFQMYDNRGYFVFRCTNRKDLSIFERAFVMSGYEYEIYESATQSIPDFERQLSKTPDGPKICLIKHSFKQGKTLCLQHVVGWYENDTTNGRHDADIAQSVGRCFGYDASQYNFPIYCDTTSILKLVEYYGHCKRRDLTRKRELPMSSTHTSYKSKIIADRELQVCVSKEQAEQVYRNWHPDYNGVFYTTKVSTNNSHDVIVEVQNKVYRQKTQGRVNIFHIDKHNKNYVDSFMSVPHWHGKYIVLYETGTETTLYQAKDKSYFSVERAAK